jgi:two-component system, NarL family, sensor histidine kinase EvgS
MTPGQREASLSSSLPATPNQRRAAAAVILILTAAFLATAPFAKAPLANVPAFVPMYESGLFAIDLITAALLFGQFNFFRSRALLVLASGYLFAAFIAVAHVLTFPGVFSPTGLLGAGPQSTAWIYMFWHAGFPPFVIAYALLKGDRQGGSVWWSVAGSFALACGFALLATVGQAALPAIMSGDRYTAQMTAVVTGVWILSVVALVALWRRRPHTVLDLWLMVVMWAWVCDIALSAVLNAGRYDVGFYAGRIDGFVAASAVLLVLLIENAKLHLGLRGRNEELEHAKQAALDAERAKGTFLATMSHEIRTPMNGVLGMLELLALSKLDGEQRTTLAIVRESGRSLLRIIDDILDFSRIEAGKLELRPEATSIADVVERVCNIYSGNASSKGLALHHFVDGRISPVVTVDGLRLQQILNNLVSNAIKFSEAGQISVRVELAARRDEVEDVHFTVEDTGVGLSAEQAARLFQPFSQVGSTTAGGTGLGLSICKRLAELMGGSLEMQSDLGVGTKVCLKLPLTGAQLQVIPADVSSTSSTAAALAAIPRPPPSAEEARRAECLVLVVDDHPVNRMLLMKQINALGYAAEVATDGLEAIDKWNLGGIGAVITDCHMPKLDGYGLASHIRECEGRHGHRRIPIIACTANAFGGEAERCFAAGMDDYVVKPASLDQLRQKLQHWLPLAEAPGSQASSLDPLDSAVLAEISQGDVHVERELLAEFRRYNVDDVRALRQAIAKDDVAGVVRASHRIQGASASIGAARLAGACEKLESAARANDWLSVRSSMNAFERELEQLQERIAAQPMKEP